MSSVQSLIEFLSLEQSSESYAADKLEREREREREKRKTQNNYTGSFHNPEVVMSPLHFQGEFTKINIWSQLLKHKSKRLQTTQAQKQEVSYAQAQK